MIKITEGLTYEKQVVFGGKTSHTICLTQNVNPHLTLLISKLSEAITPNEKNNHVGEGSTFEHFLEKQKGVRFVINGGFSHYRKNFYDWKNQDFNIGDPVGIVKIREHYFEDYLDIGHYGFFIQKQKKSLWNIVRKSSLTLEEKYILGCTPLLIFNQEKIDIPERLFEPIPLGQINPPSILGHGTQNHPRTAIGFKNNDIYFIVIEDNPGFTLLELQKLGLEMNLDSLLNLDGGGSSQFRLQFENKIMKNTVSQEDRNRILGHAIVLFDETLK